MPNKQDNKFKKQSVSMPQGLWEKCVAKAKTLRPKTSTAAYIVSLIEADLEREAMGAIPKPLPQPNPANTRTGPAPGAAGSGNKASRQKRTGASLPEKREGSE